MLEIITAPTVIVIIALFSVLAVVITLTGMLYRNNRYNLLSGELCIILTAYYAMQTALSIEPSGAVGMSIWFLVASINFVIVTIGYKRKTS